MSSLVKHSARSFAQQPVTSLPTRGGGTEAIASSSPSPTPPPPPPASPPPAQQCGDDIPSSQSSSPSVRPAALPGSVAAPSPEGRNTFTVSSTRAANAGVSSSAAAAVAGGGGRSGRVALGSSTSSRSDSTRCELMSSLTRATPPKPQSHRRPLLRDSVEKKGTSSRGSSSSSSASLPRRDNASLSRTVPYTSSRSIMDQENRQANATRMNYHGSSNGSGKAKHAHAAAAPVVRRSASGSRQQQPQGSGHGLLNSSTSSGSAASPSSRLSSNRSSLSTTSPLLQHGGAAAPGSVPLQHRESATRRERQGELSSTYAPLRDVSGRASLSRSSRSRQDSEMSPAGPLPAGQRAGDKPWLTADVGRSILKRSRPASRLRPGATVVPSVPAGRSPRPASPAHPLSVSGPASPSSPSPAPSAVSSPTPRQSRHVRFDEENLRRLEASSAARPDSQASVHLGNVEWGAAMLSPTTAHAYTAARRPNTGTAVSMGVAKTSAWGEDSDWFAAEFGEELEPHTNHSDLPLPVLAPPATTGNNGADSSSSSMKLIHPSSSPAASSPPTSSAAHPSRKAKQRTSSAQSRAGDADDRAGGSPVLAYKGDAVKPTALNSSLTAAAAADAVLLGRSSPSPAAQRSPNDYFVPAPPLSVGALRRSSSSPSHSNRPSPSPQASLGGSRGGGQRSGSRPRLSSPGVSLTNVDLSSLDMEAGFELPGNAVALNDDGAGATAAAPHSSTAPPTLAQGTDATNASAAGTPPAAPADVPASELQLSESERRLLLAVMHVHQRGGRPSRSPECPATTLHEPTRGLGDPRRGLLSTGLRSFLTSNSSGGEEGDKTRRTGRQSSDAKAPKATSWVSPAAASGRTRVEGTALNGAAAPPKLAATCGRSASNKGGRASGAAGGSAASHTTTPGSTLNSTTQSSTSLDSPILISSVNCTAGAAGRASLARVTGGLATSSPDAVRVPSSSAASASMVRSAKHPEVQTAQYNDDDDDDVAVSRRHVVPVGLSAKQPPSTQRRVTTLSSSRRRVTVGAENDDDDGDAEPHLVAPTPTPHASHKRRKSL